jgi:hypothetical protein
MPSGFQMGNDLRARNLGRNLKLLAESVDGISLALRLTRPIEVMNSTVQLGEILERAMPAISTNAKPFALLAEKVQKEYGQFALEDPSTPDNLVENLWLQLDMIDWYLHRQHYVQAVTLGREWIISVVARHLGAPIFDYENGRKWIEFSLNNAVEKRKDTPRLRSETDYDEQVSLLGNIEQLCKIWSQVTKIRNDIAHVGMRTSPEGANSLKVKAEGLFPQLVNLAEALLPARET